ncbi:hypothetical protein [Aeromonas sp. Marseille-Q7275]
MTQSVIATGFFGRDKEPKIEDSYISIVDLYTAGDYQRVIELFNVSKKSFSDFCLIEIVSKSYSRVDTELDNEFMSKIVKHMSNVLERNKDYEKSLGILACISNSLRTMDWFKQLRHFAERNHLIHHQEKGLTLKKEFTYFHV